jgi:5-methyltetrahydropteroyltriglutamate--homocysteine methyltransferase
MLKATAGKVMPTTITGSLPRPSWYTENLGIKSFLDAMVISRFREQYVDALSCYLREQEVAGLDIVTDGDCRFDQDVGGQSWTSYPPHHMDGFDTQHPKLAKIGATETVNGKGFVELSLAPGVIHLPVRAGGTWEPDADEPAKPTPAAPAATPAAHSKAATKTTPKPAK